MLSGEEGAQKAEIWTVSAVAGGKAIEKERKKMRREKWEQEHILLPPCPVTSTSLFNASLPPSLTSAAPSIPSFPPVLPHLLAIPLLSSLFSPPSPSHVLPSLSLTAVFGVRLLLSQPRSEAKPRHHKPTPNLNCLELDRSLFFSIAFSPFGLFATYGPCCLASVFAVMHCALE